MASITENPKLTSHKVIIFDVYGTLVDWESGIYTALQPLLSRYPASREWTRKEALQTVESIEKDLQVQYPEMLYWEILAKVHEVLEKRLQAGSEKDAASSDTPPESPSPHTTFGHSIKNWPLFPDTFAALQTLSHHFKLVVLSNVDHTSFGYTHAKLSSLTPSLSEREMGFYAYPEPNPYKYWFPQRVSPPSGSTSAPSSGDTSPPAKSPFTLILTAQDTHCYKPSPESYKAALECIQSEPAFASKDGLNASGCSDGLNVGKDAPLKVGKDEVLVVAQSLYHDHVPANKLGVKSVWIDRRGGVLGMVDGESAQGGEIGGTGNTSDGGEGENGGTGKTGGGTGESGGNGNGRANGKLWNWRFETLGEMADAVEREVRGG